MSDRPLVSDTQQERCTAYLRHVVDAHGGQWAVSLSGDRFRSTYSKVSVGPSTTMAYETTTEQDAVICLAFGLHQKLLPCDACPDLGYLMVRHG